MRRAAAVIAAVALIALPATAFGKWSASASGSAAVGSDTVNNATSFFSACVAGGIKLTWVKSVDTYVAVYRITRTITGGSPTTLSDQPGTATTYTDSFAYPKNVTYSYTIAARVQNWSSPQSAATVRTFSNTNKCS